MHKNYIIITPTGISYPKYTLSYHLDKWKRYTSQIIYLAKMSLLNRTKGKVLGNLWLILDPLLQSLIYFIMLKIVFNINGSDVAFLTIFLSINVWRLSSGLFVSAPSMISSFGAILQQTAFPIEVLILQQVLTQLFGFIINMILVILVILISGIKPSLIWCFLPIIFTIHLLFTISLIPIIASAGALFKDLTELMGIFMQIWFYFTPVIYSMDRIPQPFREVQYYINPFVSIIPSYRDILLNNKIPDFFPLGIIFIASLIVIYFDGKITKHIRHHFYEYL
jgi:lipopolysaccharide transport system permease protein